MSQLRKLRRHVRPLVAIDLETAPLRVTRPAERLRSISDVERRALEALPSHAHFYDADSVQVTIGGRSYHATSIHDAVMVDEVGPSLPALGEPWRFTADLELDDEGYFREVIFAAFDATRFRSMSRAWFEREAESEERAFELTPTGREPSRPEMQRLKPRTELEAES